MKNIKTNEYQTRMILYGILYHGDKNSNRFLGFEKISSFSLFFFVSEGNLFIDLPPSNVSKYTISNHEIKSLGCFNNLREKDQFSNLL